MLNDDLEKAPRDLKGFPEKGREVPPISLYGRYLVLYAPL